jgi:hypothetical protein
VVILRRGLPLSKDAHGFQRRLWRSVSLLACANKRLRREVVWEKLRKG